jgi:predicted secreted protein
MGIFSGIVLFAVIWFITLLIVLVIRQPSQAEDGAVVPGTHAGAPANPQLRKRFFWTTAIAFVLWLPLVVLILSGGITLADIDLFTRFGGGGQPYGTGE